MSSQTARPIDVAIVPGVDIGTPVPFIRPRIVTFQEVRQPNGEASATAFTFEVVTDLGPAIGRLWVSEQRASFAERVADALGRGAMLVVWATVMRERHPAGERWLQGWVEFVEAK